MAPADKLSVVEPGRHAALTPSLDDIVATSELLSRTARSPDYKAENHALTALIEVMSSSPDTVLQTLADTALQLCRAGSAGISIDESETGEQVFRWRATAGRYSEYLGGTMPREFSPCGEVLRRNAPILMINMVAYYSYVSQLNAPPQEVLLVPFHNKGKPIGTVWVVAHDTTRKFDGEDLRILKSLTNFASVAVAAFARTNELERANAAAAAASELREQFIAVLEHDLRNPLAAIANGAQMLEREVPPERVKPLAKIIGGSAFRIGELVDNLLDLTRGRLAGGIGITLETVDTLVPMIDQVVAELRSAFPDRIVTTRYGFGVPVTVDIDRIGQMISNLVGNALRHGDPRAPVTVEAHSTDELLLISVANSGSPIPAAVMERLFQPFERGSKGSSSEGLGLGLYIASEIAKAHGGSLTATSTPEQTVFRFIMQTTNADTSQA